MALFINDECVNCGVCKPNCPNDAISHGEGKYFIDSGKCTECIGNVDGPKCTEVCPVGCIEKDPEHEETMEQLQAKKEKLQQYGLGRY